MPHSHFLLIVIVTAIMLIYKKFFKKYENEQMFLITDLVKISIFCLFPKVI